MSRLVVVTGALCLAAISSFAAVKGADDMDAELAIEIDGGGEWLKVTLENSIYKAVIRVNPGGGEYGNEHAIRDWVLKSRGRDIVSAYIDACAQRPPLVRAEPVAAGRRQRSVRLFHALNAREEAMSVSLYTIFAHSPVIRVDYEKYTPWTNTVDITDLGETPEKEGAGPAETRIYGQEEFLRDCGRNIVFHEESYWNTYDEPYRQTDPADGGPLAYKKHLIMVVGEPESGVGFGRVMPVKASGVGGVKILKLLWDRGFECFGATGQGEREPFTGYIYSFTGGLDEGIEMGRRIVDGEIPGDPDETAGPAR